MAKLRAAELFIQTEGLFRMLEEEEDYVPTDEDIRAAVRWSLSTEVWQERIKKLQSRTPGSLRAHHADLARSLMVNVETDALFKERDAMYVEAQYVLEDAGFTGNGKIVARTVEAMLHALQEHVDKRMQEVFRPEASTSHLVTVEAPISPTVRASGISSARISQFLADWQKDIIAGYNHHNPLKDADQYLKTVELFIGLMGDLPLDQITFDVASEFRTFILSMPATHGKGAVVSPKKELARAAANEMLPRVTMKTVKRHFSGMRSIWKWLTYKKHVPATLQPFAGHSFPGTKNKKSARDDWSREDLQRLLTSSEYRSAPTSSALHWLPLIALHGGMRLEEICRLRPDVDIITRDAIPCFNITPREGWDPKTEAGARIIPIHPWLIKHGFMNFVKLQRTRAAGHLFSPQLPDNGKSLSKEFSRHFSKIKIALGVSGKTSFHSFRHTFRTVLDSTDLKDSHINAVMGHEGGGGEGATYTKRITTAKLKEVVEAFQSPLDLAFLEVADTSAPPPAPIARIKKRKLTPPLLAANGKILRPSVKRQ